MEDSSYGYRGYDFGTIAAEWGRELTERMKSEKEIQKYPNDSALKQFMQYYINESERIHGIEWSQKKENSMEQLIKETKIFTLASSMYTILFCLGSDKEHSGIDFERNIWMVS